MKLLSHRTSALLAGAVLLIALVSGLYPSLSRGSDRDETRARMRGVFLSLTQAYVYSLDADAFESSENHDEILTHLRALAAGTEAFAAHTADLDPSFDYMRRSLAHDANDALARFELAQYTRSRWVLFKITENCMTCHSKLPSDSSFDLSREFLEEAPIQNLEPSALAQLQIAMRQFDDALGTYEKMFRDPESSWPTLSVVGAFETYLRLCIVVRNDLGRAAKTLQAYGGRSDLTQGQKTMVATWVSGLKKLEAAPETEDELATARDMITEAQRASRYSSDRAQLVDFVASTALLHGYLQTDMHEDVEYAEAYYLLAIAESQVSTSYWISETDFLLEQAIRRAPQSQVARDAYEFLVTYVTSGHAMARSMPENVTHNLEELQALIAQ
jgi:tetratricopeptide (TPR) repeat protein